MGKISKYSNLYDKYGNFLHKPGNYSIEELEELVDTLDKNSKEFANATAILMHMYELGRGSRTNQTDTTISTAA